MDYKIVSITENEDGTTTVVQRIYEGAETTEDEMIPVDVDGIPTLTPTPVTRYRRTALLEEIEYTLEV